MRKTDKKLEKNLVCVLTEVCEIGYKPVDGFEWLTHLVDYSNFPESLQVICIFDSKLSMLNFLANKEKQKNLEGLVQAKLLEVDIRINKIAKHIGYDTQEQCEKEHQGNWAKRLEKVQY